MEIRDLDDPFTSIGLWRPSIFSILKPESSELFTPLELDIPSIKIQNPYAPHISLEDDLKLPDLETFEFGPLEDLSAPEGSAISSVSEDQTSKDEYEEDIWGLAIQKDSAKEDVKYHTWESFLKPGFVEPRSPYVSEAGAGAFDATLQSWAEQKGKPVDAGNVIESTTLVNSLFALGLGRSSVIFGYDVKKKTFIQRIKGGRMSGCSVESSQGIIADMTTCGTMVARLRDFVERTYASRSSFPGRVALANAVSSVLSALEMQLSEHRTQIHSLLHLQQAYSRPRRILSELYEVVQLMRTATSNEEMAAMMFKRCQHCEQEPDWLRFILLEVLKRVSSPWLELVEQWVGFRPDIGFTFGHGEQGNSFVGWENDEKDTSTREVEYIFRPERVPEFISPEDGQMMYEVGRSLRFLRSHHPDHPISQQPHESVGAPSLQWKFSWRDVDDVVKKAEAYERSLKDALNQWSQQGEQPASFQAEPKSLVNIKGKGKATMDAVDFLQLEPIQTFEHLPPPVASPSDELYGLIVSHAQEDASSLDSTSDTVTFAPPISLASLLSFTPLLATQARLVNAASIRLFFRAHSLRTHLDLQRSFHLFRDGVFAARLTSALFDPEASTTEHRRGVLRAATNMGLKVGARSTWPPASSELRLALMGILGDCYQASPLFRATRSSRTTAESDLPGNFSFAVRNLSDAEAEKVLDPHSLYALDFLRLQYAPPSPLGTVLTPVILDKLDVLFKFLLRLARLQFVVAHLPRHVRGRAAQFRIQAHHFVTRTGSYFVDTGVAETWDGFAAWLGGVESALRAEDESGEVAERVSEGIEDVRRRLELCLDRMLFACLLRQRQRQVMQLLEDIYASVLRFAQACNETEAVGKVFEERIGALHGEFEGRVGLFLEVCRGLGASAEENTVERLVLALEMNGVYVPLR
ncbi:hypothetical protein EJ06DRAFT_542430 [Trichodelitschia bisporula]|uniref:Spindle pole body component n=1 Tax=Trichodelitschia bisporula TaxID=703511 RepID=A0A6G1I150_9PEZI|nr:hypothetical protein EJ06DRAFT_542430 [Trichodelitschia bisporula]